MLTENSVFLFPLIIENFFLFSFFLLVFKLINYFLLFKSSLRIFQIVHIQLMLQIVNICKLFNIDGVIFFKFCFQAFIFFLILRLNIFNSFQTLFCSFIFLFPSGKFIQQFTLIKFQLFNCILHFFHLLRLIINYVSNALFDINLFGVCV
jgi:hypothetical protein